MLCEWKNKKNSPFFLKVPQQVQSNFKYEDWIIITVIASLTRKNGYTIAGDKFLSSKIYDCSKSSISNLIHDLENKGYIQESFNKEKNKKIRIIVLTKPLYEAFKSVNNNMHEPLQL